MLMNNLYKRIRSFYFPPFIVPIALLLVCVISYGLLIQRLGFYWDDWPINWIAARLGPDGLARYFSTNRPFWGMIYQLTTPLLGSVPWHWQVFGIFWRWLAAVALWGLLRLTWPRHPQAAAWAGLLFVVYPGFGQQFISLVYGHFFIILTAFLASLVCTLLALRRPKAFWLFTILGLLLSAVNLLTMEYFFLLELVRPAFIWIVLAESLPDLRQRLKRTLLFWLPYLLLFVGLALWRAFFFRFQTQNYRPKLLEQLKTQPIQAVLGLLGTILTDLWVTTFGAWGKAFQLPDPAVLGRLTTLAYAFIVLATAAALVIYLFKSRSGEGFAAARPRPWALPCLLAGLLGMLVAGWPFWLTQIPVGLTFPTDRFTLAFLLGATLFMTGLLGLLPLPGWSKIVLVSVMVGFAVGSQFQTANAFRRDWGVQKALFWQLSWRMPQLKPGTTLLFNDLPVRFFSDNSLTAPLNWIYGPAGSAGSGLQMDYMLYFPSLRLGSGLPSLQPGQALTQDYLAATFKGNTSQMVALFYDPPACARVLDPDLDPENLMIPVLMRQVARVSTTAPIIPAGPDQAVKLDPAIFGPDLTAIQRGWCYYFEKADLARQQGDWRQVAALGDQAFAQNDYPNDPSERLVFIEGYAHTGNWQRARQLSQETRQVTSAMKPVLCRLWQRIAESTPSTSDKDATLQAVRAELKCK